MLFLKDRKPELGIYLSLGEGRLKVVSQIVLEVSLIAFVAITFSLITGYLLTQLISQSVIQLGVDAFNPLENQRSSHQEIDLFGSLAGKVSIEDFANDYKIVMSPSYIGLYYLIGLGTMIVSSIAPLLFIQRLSPKEILMSN